MREDATICALSTPIGVGGLAVIRVSGPDAILCCERIFKGRSLAKTPNSSARHGFIIDPENGEMIDEVIALVMRGPNNFTGEDTVEIDCHGGMYICRRILEALIKSGCRMAMPGEFSKRAFLNGRMDLTEAEAVMDMINAETAYSLKAATSQLQGGLSKAIEQVRLSLLDCIVKMEVNIDYPEYDVPEITDEEVQDTCGRALAEVEKLLETADSGRML
ncbi:MAG: tRNA uridine-5-carboxymethylaminomethyl(34) synthesis GTPase MnmE, partial [Firmicutes bacterium]|nr:tRNA uridine-5-carboxymethylaminomethyl(34) synthesis GTPase MnmE [Bacillota bacterium]